VNSLSILICNSKYVSFFFIFAILASVVLIYDGYFSSIHAKKPKSYKDVNIIDKGLMFEPVASGFDFPTGMVFIGENDMIVIEKNTGQVIRIQNGTELQEPLLQVNIANTSERGLLGIAVSQPHYKNSTFPYVFLFYTESIDKTGEKILGNRLYRYDLVDNKLVNPKLLLDLPFLPGPSHDGGVLTVGPDGESLYLVIGNLNFIQNLTYMTKAQNVKDGPTPDGRGGILRISFDGDVIDGKGILGDDDPLNKYYAYGLRNSFGIGFDPLTGQLWDTENGQSTNDEINLVQPGFNSGWRVIQGPSSLKADFDKNDLEDFGGKGSYRDPEFDWFDTVAPTSVLFFNSDKLGDRYENDLFIGSVKNGTLYHFELSENRSQLDLNGPLADKIADNSSELKDVTFANKLGVITDLEVGPDGYLYVLSDFRRDGTVFRISPTDNMTYASAE
jgi:aldose sugar dehydrogenase